jgi:excisionase family DNA binding protein
MTTDMESAVLTQDEAAALLKVSVRTLQRMVKRGEICFTRLGRRGIRFQRQSIADFLYASEMKNNNEG